MQNNLPTKIDGALGAMIIEDQPTHSIYALSIANLTHRVNVANRYMLRIAHTQGRQ